MQVLALMHCCYINSIANQAMHLHPQEPAHPPALLLNHNIAHSEWCSPTPQTAHQVMLIHPAMAQQAILQHPQHGVRLTSYITQSHMKTCAPQGNPGREGQKAQPQGKAITVPILPRYCSVPALACLLIQSIGPFNP